MASTESGLLGSRASSGDLADERLRALAFKFKYGEGPTWVDTFNYKKGKEIAYCKASCHLQHGTG